MTRRSFRLSDRQKELLAKRLAIGAAGKTYEGIPRRRDPERRPLSSGQRRLWLLEQLEPGRGAYNLPALVSLEGALNVPALLAAWHELTRRQEALRCVFPAIAGEPSQELLPAGALTPAQVDLSALPAGRRRQTARALVAREARRGFDLGRGPLARLVLLRFSGESHELFFNFHHLISDGWSTGILVRELPLLYEAAVASRPSPLAELPVQFADFAEWQASRLRGETLAKLLDYWRSRLAGMPEVLELPADRPRPPRPRHPGGWVEIEASADLAGMLRARGQEHRATLFMVLLAGFALVLKRHTGRRDLVLGSPAAGRPRRELQDLVGFFVNTLVLRLDLGGVPDLAEILARARTAVLEAFAHQEMPFDRLVEELRPERRVGTNPLYQVMLTVAGEAEPSFPGLETELVELASGTAQVDLHLLVRPAGDRLRLIVQYDAELFDATTVQRFLEEYRHLLGSMAEDGAVASLDLLPAAQQHQLLTEWSDAPRPPSGVADLGTMLVEQAARTPDRPAVVADGETLSYGALAERSGRLAGALRRLGVGIEDRVGVCLERSPELLVAILGVLRAGAAYVPLDPDYPEERLRFMLADSGARRVLGRKSAAPGSVAWLDPAELLAGEPAAVPAVTAGPGSLAYLIYTSGSTGRPKGVAITHGNASTLLRWAWAELSAAELAGTVAATSVCFDLSVFELFVPLGCGGTVILARDALALPELGEARRATLLNTVPSAMNALVSGPLPAGLTRVNLAGEPLQPELARAVYRHPGVSTLLDLYGPSEDTTYSTGAAVGRDGRVTIGRSLPLRRSAVLDARLRPSPVGVPGELYLGGPGLARGYLGQPALTAERFVPDPRGSGERLYRTGDLARWLAVGELDFLGRLDHQVKLRGFRIELGEIEALLCELEQVSEAVVTVREDRSREPRLVAYVVFADGGEGNVEALRGDLRERVPEFMVPAAWVPLDALPLTPNGKVDRKALPAPGRLASESAGASPRTPTEEMLAGLFAEFLDAERIGVHDDFFHLGGHSLLAARLVARIRDAFGIDLPLRSLFESPTVSGLAGQLEGTPRGLAETIPRRTPKAGERLPLSFAQERLWFLHQLDPYSSVYNMPLAVRLRGALSRSALAASLERLVWRHPVLRTTFEAGPEGPRTVISPPGRQRLETVDLSSLRTACRSSELTRLAESAARRPFDLERGPLLRSTLVRLGDEDHGLILVLHHVAGDGWSFGVLTRELRALYGASLLGEQATLAELPIDYADWAVWQRRQLAGPALEAEVGYWRGSLGPHGPPALELPLDRPHPPSRSFAGARIPLVLPAALVRRLRSLARDGDATLFMTVMAVFQAFLARISGRSDFAVGLPVAGRPYVQLESVVGFFVNTLVLRADVSGRPTFGELLRRVREATLEAYEHQQIPFEKLAAELEPERTTSRTPFFQVLFALQQEIWGALELPGLEVEPLAVGSGTSKFDFSLQLAEEAGALRGVAEYSTELFDHTTIRRLTSFFERLLAAVAGAPSLPVSELPLLSAAERQQVEHEWNDTLSRFPRSSLPELFGEWVERSPDAVAVSWEGGQLTYAELARRSKLLAGRLRALGIGPESPVALAVVRRPELVIALLAILETGGHYVPLDAAYPLERLRFVLAETGARALLVLEGAETESASLAGLLASVADGGPVQLRIGTGANVDGPSPASLVPVSPPRISERALAYLVYTSGSTGRPKGVAVSHASVVRLVRETGYAAFGRDETFLQLAPVAFDASTLELWGPLLNGGRLALFEPAAPDLEALVETVARQRVTTLWLTAGLFHQLSGEHFACLRGLRQLLAGGDVLSPGQVRRALEALPGILFIDGYGPTENTTFTACHRMNRPMDVRSPVPVGRPITGTWVRVLDRVLQPLPIGVSGELFAAGEGLARGYAGRPAETAAAFVPDPRGEPGARLYCTGDVARWSPSGWIDFGGRRDGQVKVRGFRVELEEIEEVLAAVPGVVAAAVAILGAQAGDERLVAGLVADGGLPETGELRRISRSRLPEYMVPARFERLEALPLNPNGKVDRRALARVLNDLVVGGGTAAGPGSSSKGEPRGPVEEMLAGIWCQVLDLGEVGVHDDFFELGGHSLVATRVASRVREVFDVELALQELFEAPTVAGLAHKIDRRLGGGGSRRPPLNAGLAPPSGEPAPLSYAQERLWLFDQLEPGLAVYNVPLSVRLRGALDVHLLAAGLSRVIGRHEVLRTRFCEVSGEPRTITEQEAWSGPAIVDLGALDAGRCELELERLARLEACRPFDLARGPLLRVSLVRLADDDHGLLVAVHHVVADGWSLGVLSRELRAFYEAGLAGRAAAAPALPVRYADYSVWQRNWLSGEKLAAELDHWRRRLGDEGPPILELPVDRPRPAAPTRAGGHVGFELGSRLAQALRSLAASSGTTLFMTLCAAFEALLARYSGQRDFAVGTPVAGRSTAEVEPLIGFFVNTLVLRAQVAGDPAFTDWLAQTREVTLDAYAHQDLPFEKLVEELAPTRESGRLPLFQVFFAFQAEPWTAFELPGVSVEPVPGSSGTTKAELALVLEDVARTAGERGLRGTFEYSRDLFDAATILRLARHLEALLSSVTEDPALSLSRIPLLSRGERHQMAVEWNATGSGYPSRRQVPEIFSQWAARTPDTVAVVDGDGHVSYAELERCADRLAEHLRELDVGREDVVAIYLERSSALLTGVLAILRAGAAYLPVEVGAPAGRVRTLLEESRAARVLTASRHAVDLAELPVSLSCLDLDRSPSGRPAREPSRWGSPQNLALLIYTSGSTGRPKGVAIPHRAIVRLVCETNYLDCRPGERVGLASNVAFDAATLEIWGALLNGGTSVVIDRQVVLSPRLLSDFLAKRRIASLFLTTALLNLMTREEPAAFGTVRHLMFGGEAADPRWPRRILAASPPERLLHLYGPAESTTLATWQHVREVLPEDRTVPIGRAVGNTEVYVLAPASGPQPLGVAGELFVGGPGLARGYLHRPSWTAERFVPDALSGRPGDRLYASGDVAHWTARGEVDFRGRADDQLKLRGFRIEPGEIEAVLGAHPRLRSAVVRGVVPEAGGRTREKRLVAWVVAGEAPAPDVEELRRFLRERLPEYMVPAAFVFLEELPLTANGKVDRAALPRPAPGVLARERPAAPPRTPVEELLVTLWGDLLDTTVGVDDDFFELGGHSLLATRVMSRVREVFGVELAVRELFETPTVADLARRIDGLLGVGGAVRPSLVGGLAPSGPAVLSFAQERLWFLDRLEPGLATYNMPLAVRLRGPVDVWALADGLAGVACRHEVLRTRIEEISGEPRVVAGSSGWRELATADLSSLAGARRERELDRLARREAALPFDLARGPLLRAVLVCLGEEDHALLLSVHHVVADGWSLGVLVRELRALYEARVHGREASLPALAVQYRDFAVWQRGWLSGDVLAAELDHWRSRLGAHGPPVLELPADRPRRGTASAGASVSVGLGDLRPALEALSASSGTTLFMSLLAGFQALLGRYCGQRDFAMGTPVAGRTSVATESLIGLFVNTLVLRADLSGDPSFAELLERVRGVALEAFSHQELPFEKLVEELAPERELSTTPLFQVMFALETADPSSLALPGVEIEALPLENATAKFDLSVTVTDRPAGLFVAIEYAVDLFEAATVERLARHYRRILACAVADPGRRVSRLDLLSAVQRQQILEWGRGRTPPVEAAGEYCLHELFEHRAERTPKAVAVEMGEQRLDYAELEASSNRLARHLRSLGVAPETLVAISIERSVEVVVAMLAVLKAGGAYVPLDPAYPEKRLRAMLDDARPVVLVTCGGLAAGLPEAGRFETVCLDMDRAAIQRHSGDRLESGTSPENLAYVIYTSGSTGRPKGVAVPHRSAAFYCAAAACDYRLEAGDRALQFASLSFDTSVEEIFPTLASGATLVPRSDEMLASPAEFVRACGALGITVLNLTTAYWHELASALGSGEAELPGGVRLVIIGGERALAGGWQSWQRGVSGPSPCLSNTYGPTEATIVSTRCELAAMPRFREALDPPIGSPVTGARVDVLDRGWRRVPPGFRGEIVIAGRGLTRGYLGRPAATAERFVPDAFGVRAGDRAYRSGDLAVWGAEGLLRFEGRVDQQVKVRGFRIEPGDVENALSRSPVVREAAVIARRDPALGVHLAAFWVPRGQPPASARELRAFLADRLPDYMVPSRWASLEALPRLASGKIDRRALERLPITGLDYRREATALRTPLEELVAGVFEQVLRVDDVGPDDGFFELGGHSLLATQLVSRLREVAGVEVPLRVLFEHSTPTALALRVADIRERGDRPASPPILPRERKPGETGEDSAPLSFAQQRLWFLQQLEPESVRYNTWELLRIEGRLRVPALHRALTEMVRRHEILRTTFGSAGGESRQYVKPPGVPALPEVDLSSPVSDRGDGEHQAAGREVRERCAREIVRSQNRRPFDLERGPLMRTVVLRMAPREHWLLLSLHHVISDAWSMGVLVRELSALYGAFAEGRECPLSELPVQYADFAVWQRRWLRGEVLSQLVSYWKRQLAGAVPDIEFPADMGGLEKAPASEASSRGDHLEFVLPAELAHGVRELCRRYGVTHFMALLAVFETLLYRLSGRTDLVVGTDLANRNRGEVEGLIGFFINMLPIRIDLGGSPRFCELLERVRAVSLEAFAHQDLPFDKLVEEVRPQRDLSHSPLFKVVFVMQNAPFESFKLPGLELSSIPTGLEVVRFDLSLFTWTNGAGLEGVWTYRKGLFSPAAVRRMHRHFEHLLADAVADPERRIDDLEMITEEERLQQVEREESWQANQTKKLMKAGRRAVSVPLVGSTSGSGR